MNLFLSYARKSRRLFWRHAVARRYALSWGLLLAVTAACAACTVIHKEPQPTMATWTFSVCGKEVETIRVRWNYESPVEATGPETKEAR